MYLIAYTDINRTLKSALHSSFATDEDRHSRILTLFTCLRNSIMAEDVPCCSAPWPKLSTISKKNVFDLFVKCKDSGWEQVDNKYREQYGYDLETCK